jgi:hypothetical protein
MVAIWWGVCVWRYMVILKIGGEEVFTIMRGRVWIFNQLPEQKLNFMR